MTKNKKIIFSFICCEANPYYNANYGAEAYLLELGYISNSKNLCCFSYRIDRKSSTKKWSLEYNCKWYR